MRSASLSSPGSNVSHSRSTSWPRRSAVAAAMVLAVAASLLANPSAASAHTASGSWQSFHDLCTSSSSCVTDGNIVRMWQTILVNASWSELDCSFVDGDFGPNTREYTEGWQAAFGLDADGWVGNNTWGEARYQTIRETVDGNWIYYTHEAPYGGIPLYLRQYIPTSNWYFKDRCYNNSYRLMTHQ